MKMSIEKPGFGSEIKVQRKLIEDHTEHGPNIPTESSNDQDSEGHHEKSGRELENHLFSRFQEIVCKKLEKVKKIGGSVDSDEVRVALIIFSLEELANDSVMPDHVASKLKHVLKTLDIGPGPLNPPQSGMGRDSESDAAISSMKRKELLKQLGKIFPTEFIAFLGSI